MIQFTLSRQAESAFESIISYTTTHFGPRQARRLAAEFEETSSQLARMPGMGHKREDLTDRPLRFWPLHSFLIVYIPDSSPLWIARIFGLQDIATLLDDDTT
jgi:antitoxin ParD1/3/4/toxin ParE1/3/4